jgi:ATP-dependent DNA helicase RecQ
VGKRAQMASITRKPAYTVFPNSVLVELANQQPRTESEAIQIKGIGPAKIKSILPAFLKVIKAHQS